MRYLTPQITKDLAELFHDITRFTVARKKDKVWISLACWGDHGCVWTKNLLDYLDAKYGLRLCKIIPLEETVTLAEFDLRKPNKRDNWMGYHKTTRMHAKHQISELRKL